ncbi:hypothetical protein [Sphingomonas oligophenolica]|uniref:Uncharacterized protein n=1 Tax=Sphingomonas oligophenolica TaxID=301154 RepID=A0A502CK38_9SPHN|nr:hypothetical protein [Sphingomonas oligophenolica]TPG13173.1 hypothetical protein EAH84_07170 [Sphingomonas oligophenolica]
MAEEENLWSGSLDEAYIDRLILALQRATVEVSTDHATQTGDTALPAPEVITALLSIAASLLEQAPAAVTPSGMRKTAEAAGKRLHAIMRDTRRIRQAQASPHETVN